MYESKPNWEGVTITGLEGGVGASKPNKVLGIGDCGAPPWTAPTGPADAGSGSLSSIWDWLMANPWAWVVIGIVVYAVATNGDGSENDSASPRRRRSNGRRRNVAQGFFDQTGFHPIRSSADYDPDRAGDDE
jgi:hypothetical protein